uniref:NADH:ubiquinone reductase (H(+)-translocating) n=1 Tax=Fundulus heteroclitus TaxID=8078 RepID=A0A146ZDQ4_FUNHE
MLMGLIVCLIRKRAQFPLRVWLPMAMAAPTPVSSLVHSSTLVTAGLLLVFWSCFSFSEEVLVMVYVLGVLTLLVSGMRALFERDLKKVVALSTLFHLGFIAVLFSLGRVVVGYVHLVFHGGFKRLLFVIVGIIIFVLSHEQDARLAGGTLRLVRVRWVFVGLRVVRLIGVPYFRGSLSKEVLLGTLERGGVGL